MIEADFGLQFELPTGAKAQNATEQRFANREIDDVKINFDQEGSVAYIPGGRNPLIDIKEHITNARRSVVTFE